MEVLPPWVTVRHLWEESQARSSLSLSPPLSVGNSKTALMKEAQKNACFQRAHSVSRHNFLSWDLEEEGSANRLTFSFCSTGSRSDREPVWVRERERSASLGRRSQGHTASPRALVPRPALELLSTALLSPRALLTGPPPNFPS